MPPISQGVCQTAIQRHVARGYWQAAKRLGSVAQQYRPSCLTMPCEPDPYALVMATFNDDPEFAFRRPVQWGKPVAYGLFDTTDVAPGDVFVLPNEGTFYITRFEPFRPAQAILSNATVTLSGAPGAGSGPPAGGVSCPLAGYQSGYGGATAGTVVLATGWPAWIGEPGRGYVPQTGTPGALPAAALLMRLPVMPDFSPTAYMTVATLAGQAYTITGVASSQYGHECLMVTQQV